MSKVYAVSDVARMLNVNEETIRRWIREGKLTAKRAVGRGGNSINLEDVVSYVNTPPRMYLLAMEKWLIDNNIPCERISDKGTCQDDRNSAIAAVAAGSGAVLATVLTATPIIGAPIGIAAGLACGASKSKRKQYPNYTIRLKEISTSLAVNKEADDVPIKSKLDDESILERAENRTNAEVTAAELNSTANVAGILEEITRAKQMLDTGIITKDEFVEIKARLIARI